MKRKQQKRLEFIAPCACVCGESVCNISIESLGIRKNGRELEAGGRRLYCVFHHDVGSGGGGGGVGEGGDRITNSKMKTTLSCFTLLFVHQCP